MYVNTAVVGGKVVREPRTTQDGKGIMFTILMEEPSRQGGDPFKTYQDCSYWLGNNETAPSVHEGDYVVVAGSLARPRKYTNSQGETVWNRAVVGRFGGLTIIPSGRASDTDDAPKDDADSDAPF
jgi:hypothetical protein